MAMSPRSGLRRSGTKWTVRSKSKCCDNNGYNSSQLLSRSIGGILQPALTSDNLATSSPLFSGISGWSTAFSHNISSPSDYGSGPRV